MALGCLWVALGRLLGTSWALWGASWALLGASWPGRVPMRCPRRAPERPRGAQEPPKPLPNGALGEPKPEYIGFTPQVHGSTRREHCKKLARSFVRGLGGIRGAVNIHTHVFFLETLLYPESMRLDNIARKLDSWELRQLRQNWNQTGPEIEEP